MTRTLPSRPTLTFRLREPLAADYVTRAREALRLTQAELARSLGVDRVTVARWESGARRPDNAAKDRILDLVTSRLLLSLRRSVADARRRLPARARTLPITERIRPQMRRFAHVLLSGGAGRMSREEWCRLLSLAPGILQGTPRTQGLVEGREVGLAILRALTEREVAERIGEANPAELHVLGELRVLHEVQFAAAMLELTVGQIVAGAAERRAEDRKAPHVSEASDQGKPMLRVAEEHAPYEVTTTTGRKTRRARSTK